MWSPLLLAVVAEATGFNFIPVHNLLLTLRQMEVQCLEDKHMEEVTLAALKVFCGDAPKEPNGPIAEVDWKIARVEAGITKTKSDLAVLAREMADLGPYAFQAGSTAYPQSIRTLAGEMDSFDRYQISDTQIEDARVANQSYMEQLTDDLKLGRDVLADLEVLKAHRLDDVTKAESAISRILAEGNTPLADFRTRCDAKAQEYLANQAFRAAELVAIRKAIEYISGSMMLGSDDRRPPQLQKVAATSICSAKESELATREVEQVEADDLELVQRLVTEIADLGLGIAQLKKAMALASERRLEEKVKNALVVTAAKVSGAAVWAAMEVLSDFYSGPLGAASLQGVERIAPRAWETVMETVHMMESSDIIRISRVTLSDVALQKAKAKEMEESAEMTHTIFMNKSNDDLAAKTMNMKYLDLQATVKMKRLKVHANNNLKLAQEKIEVELLYLDAVEEAWDRLDATRRDASNMWNDYEIPT